MLSLNPQRANELVKEFGSPLFVYDQQVIKQKAEQLIKAGHDFHISYAMKANCNNEILKILRQNGVKSVDCVSPGEIHKALTNGYKPQQILYTQNFISQEQMVYAIQTGVILNIGALDTIDHFKTELSGKQIFVRINPDLGAGENYNVITGGPQSKFGISFADLDRVVQIAHASNIKIVGLHQHIGSNLKAKDEQVFLKTVKYIFGAAEKFSDLKYVNIGGGFGIKYREQEKLLDLPDLFAKVRQIKCEFQNKTGKQIQIWTEPGRFLVGECGVLLCQITARKTTSERVFYGTNTGFNHLIRPALYGSYHEIRNISNPEHQKQVATVCGNICQCTDNLGVNIKIGGKIGDILSIQNAGAYAFCMSSNYNQRPKPAQVLLTKNGARIIRKRQTFKHLEQQN